jgi:glucosylceramidase
MSDPKSLLRPLRRAALAVALLLGACSADRPPPPTGEPAAVEAWVTTADHRLALSPATPVRVDDPSVRADIEVDPGRRYQRMVGFGAAITDASAWLLMQMQPQRREAVLRELFGREGDGIGFDFTRLTIGASDFSRHHYSLDDPPGDAPDPQLRHFSIAPNMADVVPVVRQALAINPRLQVMASPWSAPAWMKDSGSLVKGRLRPEYYDAFSRYLLRYVDAYAAQGIPIFALTVQNEPDFEPADYPGMRLNAPERTRLVADHLGPMLAARGGRPLLFDWDHNWDKPQEPTAVLSDPKASRYVSAVAWHCYAGDVAAQSQVHDAFPGKDAYLTECSGGDWEPLRSGGLPYQARLLIVEATRHWARGVLFWNLALDPRRGPHAGGCDTCRGVVTLDPASGGVERTDDYYALAHASRFVRQGAWRIASSEGADDVDNVAFENADDGSLVLVAVNSARAPRAIVVRQGALAFRYEMPARSLATFRWHDATAVP